MASSTPLSLLALVLLGLTTIAYAHNITEILASEPDLSQFNTYLTKTKLADEINSRQTITVLALSNSALASLASKPLSVIKNVLSLHILLDYYDPQKLHSLHDGTSLSTTLYQTTGSASGQTGQVNITDLKGGTVAFGSGQPGSNLTSTYTKSVKQIPYNISVLEISAPIVVSSMLTPPATPDANITSLLDKAGCKTFSSLISSSGVLKFYQDQAQHDGLTIFAPTDEAFKAKGTPDLSKLTNAELVSLLQYHALSSYSPIGTLKASSGSNLATLAGAGKYGLTVKTAGDSVTLKTGVDDSRVASTVMDSTPLCIYSVDNVLLPVQLFGASPAPAPGPAGLAPAPGPAGLAPAPVSVPVPAPSSSPLASPPAPPLSPSESPADSPGGAEADKAPKNAGSAVGVSVLAGVFSVVCGVVSLVM